jgi:hypothetical protein
MMFPPPLSVLAPSGKITLFVLVAHSLIVLTDARFLDATYFEYFFERNRWDVIAWNFYGTQMHLWAWLMHPLLGTSHPGLWLRVTELIALIAIGICIERSARRHAGLPKGEALALGLLAVAYPAYGAAMMSNTVIYVFPTALFYVGWTLYLDQAFAERPRYRIVGACAVVWWIAFYHNSLLPYHYGLLAVMFALSCSARPGTSQGWRAWVGHVAPFVMRHWLAAILPILFFALRQFLTRSDIPFAAHNHLVFSPLRNIRAFAGGFYHHVVLNLSAAFGGEQLVLAFALAILIFFLLQSRLQNKEARQTAVMAGLAVLLLCIAIFPYAAVAKAAPLQSFGARYGMLTALGGSMLLLAVWRCLPGPAYLRKAALAVVVLGLAGRGVSDDLMWLGRWAKDRAAIAALSDQPAPRPGTVLMWQDDWRIGNETYRPFELAWFFNEAWGGEFWGGIDLKERGLDSLVYDGDAFYKINDMHMLKDFKSNDCVRTVVLNPSSPTPDSRKLGGAYLYRHLFDRAGMDRLLAQLLRVEIGPEDCETLPELLKQDIPYPPGN